VQLHVVVVNLAVLKLASDPVPLMFDQWLLSVVASGVLRLSELRTLASRASGRRVIAPRLAL